MAFHHIFETAFGYCGIAWSERGVTRFVLPMETAEAAREQVAKRAPGAREAQAAGPVRDAITAAIAYFSGSDEDFSAVALDLDGIEPMPRAIYAAARRVGYGRTTTYGALAAEAGFPNAARETGTALGRNPVPLIVPCHRILAAGGKLGGFSAPGGTRTKRRMLALEKALPPDAEPAQASFAF